MHLFVPWNVLGCELLEVVVWGVVELNEGVILCRGCGVLEWVGG